MPEIRTLDDACDFIARFCRTKPSFSWSTPPRHVIPAALLRLGERLGGTWDGDDHPYFARGADFTRRQTLFTIQDVFLDPRNEALEDKEVFTFWEENQGVCAFGWKPDDERAFVKGDWGREDETKAWRPMEDITLEMAATTWLLKNLFFMAITADELHTPSYEKSADLDVLLWQQNAWGLDGCWTDADATRLHLSWYQQTASSPALGAAEIPR